MRLPLDSSWVLDCDEQCCQLIELRIITGEGARGRAPKAENIGKEREIGHGFYGSIEQGLIAYVRKRMQGGDLTSIESLIAAIKETEARIAAVVKDTGLSLTKLAQQ